MQTLIAQQSDCRIFKFYYNVNLLAIYGRNIKLFLQCDSKQHERIEQFICQHNTILNTSQINLVDKSVKKIYQNTKRLTELEFKCNKRNCLGNHKLKVLGQRTLTTVEKVKLFKR